MRKFIRIALSLLCLTVLVAACSAQQTDAQKKGQETASQEQEAVQTSFNNVSNSQTIPVFKWSQERQTVIDVETIQATGANGTTAGYLEGVGLVWWCPSLGAPVPSTYQLSQSQQLINPAGDESKQLYSIDQGEPTGVYVGPSSGTWTICLDDQGHKFGKYWEGYVDSTVATITTYDPTKRVMPTGLTFQFTEKPQGK